MHNVPNHQVSRVAIPFGELETVRLIVEAANQFVSDNYDADDSAHYIALTMSGDALVPIRMDIVGNFLVYMHAHRIFYKVAGFIANLRKAMADNGLRLDDCIGYGPATLKEARDRLIEAKPI